MNISKSWRTSKLRTKPFSRFARASHKPSSLPSNNRPSKLSWRSFPKWKTFLFIKKSLWCLKRKDKVLKVEIRCISRSSTTFRMWLRVRSRTSRTEREEDLNKISALMKFSKCIQELSTFPISTILKSWRRRTMKLTTIWMEKANMNRRKTITLKRKKRILITELNLIRMILSNSIYLRSLRSFISLNGRISPIKMPLGSRKAILTTQRRSLSTKDSIELLIRKLVKLLCPNSIDTRLCLIWSLTQRRKLELPTSKSKTSRTSSTSTTSWTTSQSSNTMPRDLQSIKEEKMLRDY